MYLREFLPRAFLPLILMVFIASVVIASLHEECRAIANLTAGGALSSVLILGVLGSAHAVISAYLLNWGNWPKKNDAVGEMILIVVANLAFGLVSVLIGAGHPGTGTSVFFVAHTVFHLILLVGNEYYASFLQIAPELVRQRVVAKKRESVRSFYWRHHRILREAMPSQIFEAELNAAVPPSADTMKATLGARDLLVRLYQPVVKAATEKHGHRKEAAEIAELQAELMWLKESNGSEEEIVEIQLQLNDRLARLGALERRRTINPF